jgi:hypothetical protein
MSEIDDTEERDPANAVAIAWVANNDVKYNFFHSMIELLAFDVANNGRVWQGGYVGMRYGTDGLVQARNEAVSTFLDEKRADWLFWIDTDMGFAPDTIERLVDAADPAERPIVGALAFTQRETGDDGMGGRKTAAAPTIFDWATVDDQSGFAIRYDYPANTVTRVHGTGSACILIHRPALEAIGEKFGTWYTRVPNTSTGQLISEDLSFCIRANALDIPIHVHTGVRTTHQKTVWLSEEHYWQERALNPPPAPPTNMRLFGEAS